MSNTDAGFLAAVAEAEAGAREGGIPVGSALVNSEGQIIGRGHNQRAQNRSIIFHAEMAAFEAAKHLRLQDYEGATLFTTLSPCPMCAGAAMFFRVKKVVIAENVNMSGSEGLLREKGIEVVVLNDRKCQEMMSSFIANKPDLWEEGTPVSTNDDSIGWSKSLER